MTNAGKKMMFGGGKVTYTRAALFTQDISHMSDEQIRQLSALTGQLLSASVGISGQRPQDTGNSTIKVETTFSNAKQKQDAHFSTVGWFAQSESTAETLIAVCEVEDGLLGAGDPSGASTASINASINITIGNSTAVTAIVDPSGVVTKTQLDSKVNSTAQDLSAQIAKKDDTTDVDAKIGKLKASVDTKADKATVDSEIGKIDFSPYAKIVNVNQELSTKADKATVNQQIADANNARQNGDNSLQSQVNSLKSSKANQSDLDASNGARSLTSPNANNITSTGPYYIISPTTQGNFPTGSWGTLEVFNGQGHKITQMYFPDDGSAPYYRILDEKSWRPWKQLLNTDESTSLQNQINTANNDRKSIWGKLNAGVKALTETRSLGGNDDANEITQTGIYRIGSQEIKNGNDRPWAFLIALQWDMNTILQYILGNGYVDYRYISVTHSQYPGWVTFSSDLPGQITDLANQVNYIKQNYVQGKRFTNEAQAEQWENANPNGIAFVEK